MRRKILVTVLIMLTGILYAQQSLMSQRFTQDTDHYWKTKYLFSSGADWFMDPNDYGKLELESFFAAAMGSGLFDNSVSPPTRIRDQVAGGFAKNFGPVYLGTYFDLNFGDGNDPGFKENNELQLIVGTSFMGAFKPFVRKYANEDVLFGIGWGMNFPISNGTLKPEFMIGYNSFNTKTAGIEGYLNAGASVDIDFNTSDRYASSVQINYEIQFGMPSDDKITGHNHIASFLYQRLYNITEALAMGWGFGASGIFEYYKVGSSKAKLMEINAETVLGFSYSFGGVFGILGQLFFVYPVEYEDGATEETTIGGPQLYPVLGGFFRPHPNFTIEMRCNPGVGLGGLQPAQFALMATIKK